MGKFDLNNIYFYKCGDFYYVEQEIRIGLYAISDLVKYQEETYKEKRKEFLNRREEKLAVIEEEFKGQYDRQFFQEEDMGFNELKYIQRNAVCLVFFSFYESQLLKLFRLAKSQMGEEVKEEPQQGIIKALNRYFIKELKIDNENVEKFYTKIASQINVRNAIAHTQSQLSNPKKFCRVEGLELYGSKVNIVESKYLINLINWANRYFVELLEAIDKKIASK
ncbi:hypothetical protein [Tenacibaculum aestuarii]|uniref:hypothetical protein n=1 Tax=Tenacibaculum aestuarii TaxID=362781 RepID=UPI00389362A9